MQFPLPITSGSELTSGLGVTVTVNGSYTTTRTIILWEDSGPDEHEYLAAWCSRILGKIRAPPRTMPSVVAVAHDPLPSCRCQLTLNLIYYESIKAYQYRPR